VNPQLVEHALDVRSGGAVRNPHAFGDLTGALTLHQTPQHFALAHGEKGRERLFVRVRAIDDGAHELAAENRLTRLHSLYHLEQLGEGLNLVRDRDGTLGEGFAQSHRIGYRGEHNDP
jgi:hypothetical protein